MKTLGIEMIDAGFEVAVGRLAPGSGAVPSAERLTSPGTIPAVVALDEGEFHFGLAAEERRFLFPRQVSDVFWEEFSLSPSGLRRGGRTLSFSEVSFHFLRHLVNGLPGVASEHESLALAVPPPFIEGGDRAEERVGILLGICRDLELRLATIVDAACVSLLDPEEARMSRGPVLHVDLGLHSAVLTLLEVNGTITRRASSRVAGTGWLALTDLTRRSLANRFLRQTSFDVSSERRTEQEFYLETLGALDVFTSQSEAWLRIVSASRERAVTIPREALVADLSPLVDTVTRSARGLLVAESVEWNAVRVVLTSRARHLCGLAKAFRAEGVKRVTVLTPGAAARGAAVVACKRRSPEDLAEVGVESTVALQVPGADTASALDSAVSLLRHRGNQGQDPTHVVFDGMAVPLGKEAFRIGSGGNGRRLDISLSIAPVGFDHLDIVIEPIDGHWHAAALVAGRRHNLPEAEAPLAPGDTLEVSGATGVARVMFIKIAG